MRGSERAENGNDPECPSEQVRDAREIFNAAVAGAQKAWAEEMATGQSFHKLWQERA